MNPHIIGIGYKRGEWLSVICDEEGLKQLPEPMEMYRDGGGNLHIGARIALTKVNLVALRMIGALSDNDIGPMLKTIKGDLPGEPL